MKNRTIIAVLSVLILAAGAAAVRAQDAALASDGVNAITRLRPPGEKPQLGKATRQLELDGYNLCRDEAALIKRVDNIKATLQTTANALGVLSALETDLRILEASVETLYTAAQTAEAIPQSREKAKPIRESLGTARTKVKSARATMTAITLKTEPIRLKLNSAADKADKVSLGLQAVNVVPCATRPLIATIDRCIQTLPDPACAYKTLDFRAEQLSPYYVEYDKAVKLLLTDPVAWLPSLDFMNPFTEDMRVIEQLRRDIEALTSRLDSLARQLGPLNAILDQRFGFSFPYPNPKWDNPLRVSNYSVTVSGRVIMQGADAIQRAIEDYLSSYLWEILNGLGVGKYVRQLQDAANGAVDAAMRAIHFDMDVDLPSLDILETFKADELGLENALAALNIPEPNLKTPGLNLPGMPSVTVDSLSRLFRDFHPLALQPEHASFCKVTAPNCK